MLIKNLDDSLVTGEVAGAVAAMDACSITQAGRQVASYVRGNT